MNRTTTWAGAAFAAVLALAAAGSGAPAAEAPTLDEALGKRAPDILKYLRDQNYKNVGVLKFMVALGDGPPRDDVGVINRGLADRLEVALVLALKPEDEGRLGILLHASDKVAEVKKKDSDLNHLTADGRQDFFENRSLRFPRAWGSSEPVHADAFLTGGAVVAADARSVQLRIQIFDGKNPRELKTIGDPITAVAELRTLTDCGYSFHKKGFKHDADDSPDQHQDNLAEVTPPPPPDVPGNPAPPPPEEKKREVDMDDLLTKSPVQLEILYNGVPAKVQGGLVEEPQSGTVAFRLTNTDAKTTYGVVLKINGENTIDREKIDDLYCHKWVLAPGKEILVEGFQTDDGNAGQFEVLPTEESKAQEVNYADDKVGLIQMVLFRQLEKQEEPVVKADETRNLETKAVSRGSLVVKGQRPDSLKALQDKLMASVDPAKKLEGKKGLVVPGKTLPSETEQVDFSPDTTPERSIVLHYYQPQK